MKDIELNDFSKDLGNPLLEYKQSNYRKYTIYGTFNSNVCSYRCKNIQPSKLFQKCSCK